MTDRLQPVSTSAPSIAVAGDALVTAVLAVAAETSLPVVLHRLITVACGLTDARYGALGVISPEGTLAEFITVGIDAEGVAAIGEPPKGHGILGLLIVDPRPLRLADLGQHVASYGFPPHHPPMASFLGVPIRIGGEVYGNLYLTDKLGAPEFSEDDERLCLVLATAAGAAIENLRSNRLARDLAVAEDRERIARDLHDSVIQRLFATGMSLQATQRLVADEKVSGRLASAVDDLDATIREIRAVIFAVDAARRQGVGLRADLLGVVADAVPALGFEPLVSFDGPIDTAVPEGIADHLLAVLREALTNVARHAKAGAVTVHLVVDQEVVLAICDDGRGLASLPAGGRVGNGLRNMGDRARALGGSAAAVDRPAGGTELLWRVPLHG